MDPVADHLSPLGPSAIRIARVEEHSFLAGPLGPDSTLVDLGTNTGNFATKMISQYGCSIVGVEPVPHLFAQIPKVDGLTVHQLAVNADAAPVTLFLSSSPLGATTDTSLSEPGAESIQVDGITFEQILDRHGIDRTPLVKVDIEGAELPMIDGASIETLQRADQYTIEFHDFLEPSQAEGVQRAKQRLAEAGFCEMAFSTNNSDVLFVNRAHVPFGAIHRTASALLYKYPRGVIRHIDRIRRDRQTARGLD